MEENTNQSQPVQTPVEPNITVASDNPAESKNGGSGLWIIIIVIVVLLIAAAGFYFYSNMEKTTDTVETTTEQTKKELDSLQSELNTTDQNEMEADFTQIDKDLAAL